MLGVPMRILLVATLFALTALAGCSGSDPVSSNPSGDQNAYVSMKDFNFNPTTVNIQKGSVVQWNNTGAMPHTATANDGEFDSGNVVAGGTFSHTFGAVGTFAYTCKIHPNMTGTIKVSA